MTLLTDVADELNTLASVAGVVFALLAFFTAFRIQALQDALAGEIGGFDRIQAANLIADLMLFCVTAAATYAMHGVVFDQFSLSRFGEASTALASMTGLVWGLCVVLALVQLALFAVRGWYVRSQS